MKYSTEKEILQPILDHGMKGMSEVLQKLLRSLKESGSSARRNSYGGKN